MRAVLEDAGGNAVLAHGLALEALQEQHVPRLASEAADVALRIAAVGDALDALEAELARSHGRVAALACVLRGGGLPRLPAPAPDPSAIPAS